MSLVNAVHALLEVAAGRLNLTPEAADALHASIDAEQNPPQAPDPEPEVVPYIADNAPPLSPPSEPIPGTLTVGA